MKKWTKQSNLEIRISKKCLGNCISSTLCGISYATCGHKLWSKIPEINGKSKTESSRRFHGFADLINAISRSFGPRITLIMTLKCIFFIFLFNFKPF